MRSVFRTLLKSRFVCLKPTKIVRLVCASTILSASMVGCATQKASLCDRKFCDDIQGIGYYQGAASKVAYPCIDTQTTHAVASSIEPRNLGRRTEDTPLEISLTDVIQSALTQNKVIETSALGGVGAKGVLANPTTTASVYDPALQASGVLFGRRSVESALSDFDAQFTTSLSFQRTDLVSPPNSIAGGGNAATFSASLSKALATGGSVSLNHDINYTVDAPLAGGSGRTPNYGGRLGLEIRQPLLAGAGVGYTRIAGPSTPGLGGITGVSQGVVIARINEDVSIADFQIAVRNAVRDIESAYWDLYQAYRVFDTAVVAHESAFRTWREARDRLEAGILKPADELQAEDRLYQTKAQVEQSLSQLYTSESELRRLAGMPMNDGTVLRPSDDPIVAEIQPDWATSLTEALTHRVELRRQKWQIKSLQLQLQAAQSLVRPRLDIVAGYDVNGAGDKLLSQSKAPYSNFYGSMTHQNLNSWNAGLQLSIPIGFRFTRTQVANLELELAKANGILASQEKNIAHDITNSIQNVTASFAASQSGQKRLKAAAKRVELLEKEHEVGTLTLDLVLRAQASLAEAENAYYQYVVAYRKALIDLDFSTGRLLNSSGVALAEGPWCANAYKDARIRAHERTHAKDAHHLQTAPAEFVSPGPTGTVNLYPQHETPFVNLNQSGSDAAAGPGEMELKFGTPPPEPLSVPQGNSVPFEAPVPQPGSIPQSSVLPNRVLPPSTGQTVPQDSVMAIPRLNPVVSPLVEPGDRTRFQLNPPTSGNESDRIATPFKKDVPR